MKSSIGGLHRRHVGGQNKTKFVLKVCIKMEVNSQRRKISLLLPTNMAAMTSHANHQYGRLASSKQKPLTLLKSSLTFFFLRLSCFEFYLKKNIKFHLLHSLLKIIFFLNKLLFWEKCH